MVNIVIANFPRGGANSCFSLTVAIVSKRDQGFAPIKAEDIPKLVIL